ncbi:MAG: hypothetical protein Kow00124_26440 [Anaerolineae bacterium]
MTIDSTAIPKVLQLYLELSQYPILAGPIRQRMREELFSRGIISQKVFEAEVREKAIQSQRREGIINPMQEEPLDIWETRLSLIRDHLTDFYFAYNLPHDLFKQIVEDVLTERNPGQQEMILAFNPELAPWDILFKQGEAYESYPAEQRAAVLHHLREIIVVLIKAMISDQLSFVRVAREYFTIKDLKAIRANRIGRGKIGGKAAGMLLAYKILQRHAEARGIDPERITIPDSWYLGSDVYYQFHSSNDMFQFMNQKYKRPEQMREDYPKLYNRFLSSRLPDDVEQELAALLETVGRAPLIVRSSSLLEDNFDTSFAGKYDSFFLPNQGTPEENLTALTGAIIRIYASVIRPEALIYRDRMGLIDYDERMAILIQRVEGRRYKDYFFPALAGVGFSHNPYRWNKRIRLEDGLLRMVTGLGTRAVDRVSSDYPRMVALSHPALRPERTANMVRHYSQHLMDVIDLKENAFKTVPVSEVFDIDYIPLGAIISLDRGGFVQELTRRPLSLNPDEMVVTFDRLLKEKAFIDMMRETLDLLEEAYNRPVDVEFAGDVITSYPRPQARMSILQCRPLSQRKESMACTVPEGLPETHILFTAHEQIPQGCVDGIRYIVYVDPHAYAHIPDPITRTELGQVVSRLNQALANEVFILMGPGRWGSSNTHLGVKVNYADIYNTRMLIEIAYEDNGNVPEVSYGTHFFQDLVEADIYPLPLYPDARGIIYREAFFKQAPNVLAHLLPADERYSPYIKVIDVPAASGGHTLSIVMDGETDYAVAYFSAIEKPVRLPGQGDKQPAVDAAAGG